ncbi:hypothetical protein PQO00_17270, partial [Flavivirga sp. 57AJ16]|nr:hypothetical protein [Flavivirga sp. 57AJ16]
MDRLDKIKLLSEKIAASLLKGGDPIDIEEFNMFTEDDKKRILLNITDKGKREERSRLMDGLDKQKIRNTIMARARERRARKNRDRRYIAVAASVAILLGATFLLDRNGAPTVGTIVADNHISTGTDRATLTLADGSEVALEKGRPYRSG